MKKIYTLLIAIAISTSLISQTFLTEDFSDGIMPPTGWSINNLAEQWINNVDNKAGGSAPEARYQYSYLTDSTRLISPQINLSGYESVILEFKHHVKDSWNDDISIGVATRSGGGDWNIAWQITPSGNIDAEELYITINNDDVGAEDFQLCFFVKGELTGIYYWSIDDVALFSAYNTDCEMETVTTYPFILEPVLIDGVVCNKGLSPITSIEVSWQVDNGAIHTSSYSGFSIDLGEKYEFECPDLFNYPIGTYDVNVWLSSVNGTTDDNTDNDLYIKNMSVISNTVYKRPMMELFTSSNSGNSAWVNAYFNPWSEEHADSITLIKNPTFRPGPADPYYTDESKERGIYYNILDWPEIWFYGNGMEVDPSLMMYIEEFYQEAKQEPGFASIVASRSTVSRGTIMDIDVTILPYANFNNHRLFAVVFENTTTGNVGNNGETEFKHVVMKMVPDQSGTAIQLYDREPITITQSIDLEGTFIEEWDDLNVAIFIQDIDLEKYFNQLMPLKMQILHQMPH